MYDMKSAESDNAVSPVIGTILLVAITVVLIAIIAAVIMGMSGGIGNNKEVGLYVTSDLQLSAAKGETSYYPDGKPGTQADEDRYYPVLSVTIMGGKDVAELRYLNVSIAGADAVLYWGHDKSHSYAHYVGKNLTDGQEISRSELIGTTLNYLPLPIAGPVYHNTGGEKLDESTWRVYDESTQVVITGTFLDGTEQVIYKGNMQIRPAPKGNQGTAGAAAGYVKVGGNESKGDPPLWRSPKIV